MKEKPAGVTARASFSAHSYAEARNLRPAPLFSCCGYAHLIHRTAETEQDHIVNLS
jgi:hypothetical protein